MCGVNGSCVLYVYTNTRRPEQLLGIINWVGGAPANAENVWRRAGQHTELIPFHSVHYCFAAACVRACGGSSRWRQRHRVCLCLRMCVSYPWRSPCCRWDWRSSSRVEEPRICCKTKTETLWAFQLKYYTIIHSCLSEKRKCGRAQRQRPTSQQQALHSLTSPSLIGTRKFCNFCKFDTGRLGQTRQTAITHSSATIPPICKWPFSLVTATKLGRKAASKYLDSSASLKAPIFPQRVWCWWHVIGL